MAECLCTFITPYLVSRTAIALALIIGAVVVIVSHRSEAPHA